MKSLVFYAKGRKKINDENQNQRLFRLKTEKERGEFLSNSLG